MLRRLYGIIRVCVCVDASVYMCSSFHHAFAPYLIVTF